MRKLKARIGSWDWRVLMLTAAGFVTGLIPVAVVYFYKPTSVQDFGMVGIASSFSLLLLIRLRRLMKRPLPISRVKHTIEMSLIEIINEFAYTGYRVEAMTENTVVLVRFSYKHLILGALLLAGLGVISVAILAENSNAAAIIISVFSFMVVYVYTIVGYGYDRIVFNQREQDGPTTCVTFVNAFLPSRVDLAIVSTEDHGDKEWYRAHPNRL